MALRLIVLMGIVGLSLASPSAQRDDRSRSGGMGPGCAPGRPAVAHRAGGGLATAPPGSAPIPCVTATGYPTSEPSIAVTNRGTVLFNPAIAADRTDGVIRSVDGGRTWQFAPHAPNGAPVTNSTDANVWVDRPSGRAFWLKQAYPRPTPPRMDFSDDDGRNWTAAAQPCPNRAYDDPLGCGHPWVFSGPPVAEMRSTQRAFSNVVYVCAGGSSPLVCQKSVDGGKTWVPPVRIPSPGGLSCKSSNHFGFNGVVDRRGTVYVPFTPCQRPYVAISRDEGATWNSVLVADTNVIGIGVLPLAIDQQGNLYAAWAGEDRKLYLAISRDQGAHWSEPWMIAAPGVKEVAVPQAVAGSRGHVAITYYGSTNAPEPPFPAPCKAQVQIFSLACPPYANETWNTYVTETFDALTPQPVFWSATLNDPAHPTWFGCSPSTTVAGGPVCTGNSWQFDQTVAQTRELQLATSGGRLDYFGMTMAPDGTPWVGFVQQCPDGKPVPGNPNCPSTLTGNRDDSLMGMVGRLVRPRKQ